MTEFCKVYDHPFGIKEYSYSDFTQSVMDSCVEHLEKHYFSNPDMCDLERPGHQTIQTLFGDPMFSTISNAFLLSVRQYVNDPEIVTAIDLNQEHYLEFDSWCYVNWKDDTYDEPGGWHSHNENNFPSSLSGIFFLRLQPGSKSETKFHVGANLFELPPNEWSWFIFPSTYLHCPGDVTSSDKRYTISADLSFTKHTIK